MMVMVANHSSGWVHYLAGRHPGKIGHLYSPGEGWKNPVKWLPYALDNGAYTGFDEASFFKMLDAAKLAAPLRPRWVAVPDVVGNREATLESWAKYWQRVADYGWPLAFVVQDGMSPADVPGDAAIVFVGGSPTWKLRSLSEWAKAFDRVHVGRINTERLLWICDDLGIESVDGTGWFHRHQAQDLEKYLECATALRRRQFQNAFDTSSLPCN